MSKRLSGLAVLSLTMWVLFALWHALPAEMQGDAAVSGTVLELAGGAAAGATVRIQATTNATITAGDGTFTLHGLTAGTPVTVSAWKYGYYCAKVEAVVPPATGITLTLRPYQKNDNPDYEWILPTSDDPSQMTCATCKPGVTQIWLDNDAHARSGSNARFLSMYNGTDVSGTLQAGPGYVLDFPGTAGNCANCHAPSAALDAPFTTNMNQLPTIDSEFGVHCDFCHKVAAVYLNPATGLPYNNAPGVISMAVRRPFPDTERYQLFFGTFDDDNVPEEDTYLPLLTKSQWCATCHQFSFWGTPIYQSFREWKESAYPAQGIECQTCHMPSDGVMTNVAPGQGGVERDPLTIHAHTMPGAANVPLLQRTVAMTVTAQVSGTLVSVDVAITNVFAGHHVPTDYPGRNMILLVRATDSEGHELSRVGGPQVPDWGGVGGQPDDYAGRPGKGYAKILRDRVTGEWPVVSYWKQAFIHSDNRIPAGATDESHYQFELSPVAERAGPARPRADEGLAQQAAVRVEATLLFRRLFIAQAREKGWNQPDIVMAQQEVTAAARE